MNLPAIGIMLVTSAPIVSGAELAGVVVDAANGAPIAGATVTSGTVIALTDSHGRYRINSARPTTVAARAIGYGRVQVEAGAGVTSVPALQLRTIRPHALYLSYWGIGDTKLRSAAIALADAKLINALVIDVKDDRGNVLFPSDVPAAAHPRHTVSDATALLKNLRDHGLYLIARIAVFKDDRYANLHPEWAYRLANGVLYHDRQQMAWIDPTKRAAWRYSIDIAAEAARLGFDEIQFDYVRFPDTVALNHAVPETEQARTTVLAAFFAEARARLTAFNVFLAADIFGYVCWNTDDTRIGQRLDTIASQVDYLSPMLYPSGFQFGIPGYRDPVLHPYDIVYLSLSQAVRRSGISPLRFRPWLQAFRDYAFDRRSFNRAEIRQQIDAASRIGTDGWMLWNPRNSYSANTLTQE